MYTIRRNKNNKKKKCVCEENKRQVKSFDLESTYVSVSRKENVHLKCLTAQTVYSILSVCLRIWLLLLFGCVRVHTLCCCASIEEVHILRCTWFNHLCRAWRPTTMPIYEFTPPSGAHPPSLDRRDSRWTCARVCEYVRNIPSTSDLLATLSSLHIALCCCCYCFWVEPFRRWSCKNPTAPH